MKGVLKAEYRNRRGDGFMAWKPLPIGVDDFKDLIKNKYFFIDKTLFIKELLDMKGKVNPVPDVLEKL